MSYPAEKNDLIILQLLRERRFRVDFNTGEVFSILANSPTAPLGSINKRGYLRTGVNFNGGIASLMVHRIVWIAKHGIPDPATPQINHIDTIKTHNYLSNLELQDNAGNCQHAARHGLMGKARGELAHRSKLNRQQVHEIRAMSASGESVRCLADRFAISKNSVRSILVGESWSWLHSSPANFKPVEVTHV